MKEPVLIAVDCGKYATKAILKSKDKHAITVFRTKIQEAGQVGLCRVGIPLHRTYSVSQENKVLDWNC